VSMKGLAWGTQCAERIPGLLRKNDDRLGKEGEGSCRGVDKVEWLEKKVNQNFLKPEERRGGVVTEGNSKIPTLRGGEIPLD